MSDEPAPVPPDGTPVPPGGDLQSVVQAVGELLSTSGAQPSLLEVRSGALAVHMEWRDADPAATGGARSAPSPPATDGAARHYLTSPVVGTFYRAKEPGAEPFVDVGDQVAVGQQVAIIEAMKLMLPVEADRDGVISEVLQADGAPVEYGTRLFAVGSADMP